MSAQSTRPMSPIAVILSVLFAVPCLLGLSRTANAEQAQGKAPVYTYTLTHDASPDSYDEAAAVACLQGIINRDRPRLHVLSKKDSRPEYWLKILSNKGRWLEGKTGKPPSHPN